MLGSSGIARSDGPQSQDVLGGKVIGLRGWPIVPGNPTDGQAVVWSQALGAFMYGGAIGNGGTPGGAIGSIQIKLNANQFGGLAPSTAFSTANGVFGLAPNAACFNLGPWSGDLFGAACSPPSLAVGAASRNVGTLGGALNGALPNPGLDPATLFSTMGTPAGDLGGSSYQNPTVVAIQGFPVSSAAPQPQSALIFNNGTYTPTVISPGINQLTGQLIAGPGAGSQPGSIAANTVTNQQLVTPPGGTVKCNASAGVDVASDCPVTGGLAFSQGALQLSPTLGPSQSQTISDGTNKFCMIITNGVITNLVSGACTTGSLILTADDGATQLTADDGATLLTADGTNPTTPCNSAKYAFNVACNASVWTLFRSAF